MANKNMKRISTRKLPDGILHIEAPGCVINIHPGLHNSDGQEVTAIAIQCDQYAGEPKWTLPEFNGGKYLNVRVLRDEVKP